ncbi:MAG: HAD-IIIA family hydrolase [Candidatus Gastranaerophilales bacterium]
MFIKPDYNVENIYAIDLNELKSRGINAFLFDLDSTLMASKSGFYTEKTLEWLQNVKKDFFVGVVSNNDNLAYEEKVLNVSDFPVVFSAHKPEIKVARKFMRDYSLDASKTVFVGDRPLTDIVCGKRLGCVTILVDSITAEMEKPIVRFARACERSFIRR